MKKLTPAKAFEIFHQCLAKGRKYFPKPLEHIHDEADQESDFAYGVALGLKKIKWNIGDPIEFLTRNGIFYLRTKRWRAMEKGLRIRCLCGNPLTMSQKPCHGSMEDRHVYALKVVVGSLEMASNETEVLKQEVLNKPFRMLDDSFGTASI